MTELKPAKRIAKLTNPIMESRKAFSGLVTDLTMADKSQADLFAAIGRVKAPFRGIGDWPYLNGAIQTRSAKLLATDGEDRWRAAGGIYGADGKPTFSDRSAYAAAVVGETVAASGGFVWTDETDTGWAVTLLKGRDRESDIGLAVSWCGGGRLLDPLARDEYRRAVEAQMAELAAPEPVLRRQLERIASRIWLYERAEQMLWLIHGSVMAQRKSVVLLPDIGLGEVVWGGDRKRWPDNWRGTVADILWSLSQLYAAKLHLPGQRWRPRFESRSVAVAHVEHLERSRKEGGFCRRSCPLWNRPDRHGHFLIQVGCGFLGVLENFAVTDDTAGLRQFDFRRDSKGDAGKALKAARKNGFVVPVHLPTKVFGPSDWSGLTRGQRGIIQGIIREVTRPYDGRKTGRPDQAEVVIGNRVPAALGEGQISCDHLRRDGRYVAYNGNGRRRGKGYLIVGRKRGGWLAKCGYLDGGANEIIADHTALDLVRDFLRDLGAVAKLLSLVPVGIDPRSGQWLDLDTLTRLAWLPHGADQLSDIHLRIYGPEDYLARCRALLAARGGFSDIPGARSPQASLPTQPVLGDVNLDLRLRMRRAGLTQRQLASELGVSEGFVSGVLKGSKKWPRGMRSRAERAVADAEAVGVHVGPRTAVAGPQWLG